MKKFIAQIFLIQMIFCYSLFCSQQRNEDCFYLTDSEYWKLQKELKELQASNDKDKEFKIGIIQEDIKFQEIVIEIFKNVLSKKE